MTIKRKRNTIPKKVSKSKTIRVLEFSFVETLTKWIRENRVKNHNYRKYPIKVITFNFDKVRFLKPFHIAPLSCLIHEYIEAGFKIKIKNTSANIKGYLDSFDFYSLCENKHKNNYNIPSNYKTFPLWKIEENAISLYPTLVQKYYERNHFSGKSLFSLSISLAELFNNVFDHSGSTIPGFTFTQYNSSLKTITICVCDFGIGIPHKVNNYLSVNGEHKINNIDALKKSFEQNFSTKSKPHNRGFGWDNIFSNISSLESKMLIVSNNVTYFHLKDDTHKEKIIVENFPGTLVVIWLNTDHLPLCEEELTDVVDIF